MLVFLLISITELFLQFVDFNLCVLLSSLNNNNNKIIKYLCSTYTFQY